MKKIMIVLTLVAMIVVMGGCNSQQSTHPAPTAPDSEISQPQEGEKEEAQDIPFEEIADESTLPQDVQDAISEYKAEKGYKVFNAEAEQAYVLITAGEKRTGGYGIEVVSVQNTDNTTRIIVKETSPGEDDMVTKVLTYPYTAVKISDLKEIVTVYNTEGDQFSKHN